MAPGGTRSSTISTFTNVEKWWKADNCEEAKKEMKNRLFHTVAQYFPGFDHHLDLVLAGTPVTFLLRRKKGKGGGYIPRGRYSWLNNYFVRTGVKNIYPCGDTIFPGVGTLGVALSGIMATKEVDR